MNEELAKKYPRFNENKITDRRTRVFSLLKRPDACYYYRILTPHQQLVRQFGWHCKFNPIDPLPQHLQQGIPSTQDHTIEGSLKNLLDCHGSDLDWADIIIMQRPTCDHHLALMKHIQDVLKKPVVYEADDNYIDVPKWNPGYKYFEPRSQYIKEMIERADVLTVTTEYLADIYRSLRRGKEIRVCPNSLDFEFLDAAPTNMMEMEQRERRKFFTAMKQMHIGSEDALKYKEHISTALKHALAKKNEDYSQDSIEKYFKINQDVRFTVPDNVYSEESNGKVKICWGGSPTHKADLAVVTNPLLNTLREYPDAILGMVGFIHGDWMKTINRNQLWQFGLVPVKYYYSLYKQIGMTIGIAPVNKDQFNMGKSNLKIIEYMALGIYAIASDYETYKGESIFENHCGPNVPLCNSDDDWNKELKRAVDDGSMRFEIAQSNRAFAEENYNIAINVKYWKEAYEHLI